MTYYSQPSGPTIPCPSAIYIGSVNALACQALGAKTGDWRRLSTMNNNRLLGVLLAAALVALGVLAYLYYERTRPVAKIDVPGVSGEITKEGVHVEVGKPKD